MSVQHASFHDRARQLKSQLPISSVFSHFGVMLKPQGREWVALCPFHDDSNPSLSINDAKGVYYCRACQATGDQIALAGHYQGLNPGPALDYLCDHFIPELSASRHPQPNSSTDRTTSEASYDTYEAGLAVLDAAATYFQHQLPGSVGEQHLKQRHFDASTLEAFTLGFAPASYHCGRCIQQHLTEEWASALTPEAIENLAIDTGLLKRSDADGRVWAFFRERIIFPIRDYQGRVVGFAGRCISGERGPKYLNTADTRWFRKASSLFATNAPAHASVPAFIVEGYTDVLAVYQAGGHALATMGTAFNDQHAAVVARWHPGTLICALDGDQAGRNAHSSIIDSLARVISDGQSLQCLNWPDGTDPAGIIDHYGTDGLARLVDQPPSIDGLQWRLQTIEADLPKSPNDFARCVAAERQAAQWFDWMRDNAPVSAALMREHIRALGRGHPRSQPPSGGAWLDDILLALYLDPSLVRFLSSAADRFIPGESSQRRILDALRQRPASVDPSLAVVLSCGLTARFGQEAPSSWWSLISDLSSHGMPEWVVHHWHQRICDTPLKKPASGGLNAGRFEQLIRLALAQFRLRPLWQGAG